MSGNGGKPKFLAQMYTDPPGISAAFLSTDTYQDIGGLTEGINDGVTINGAAGSFTIERNGTYKFDGVAALFPSAGLVVTFTLFVNAVRIPWIESTIDFKNSQDTQTFSGSGILELVEGDVITIAGKVDALGTVNVLNMNVNLFKI